MGHHSDKNQYSVDFWIIIKSFLLIFKVYNISLFIKSADLWRSSAYFSWLKELKSLEVAFYLYWAWSLDFDLSLKNLGLEDSGGQNHIWKQYKSDLLFLFELLLRLDAEIGKERKMKTQKSASGDWPTPCWTGFELFCN